MFCPQTKPMQPGRLTMTTETRPRVQYVTDRQACSCPDRRFRHRVCKHMRAIAEAEALLAEQKAFNEARGRSWVG